ncbi:3' exoribonuclease family, domain 1 family protein [Cryptosporidium meleagridis]|uniref:Ribosomal RNA-processing protein 42 n=1 Tax=Cryptosporidium meleagridis TaxID=93969 RepID=A0A2P4Z5T1_9CRYT|nr:3' exoribonuclease family, domain 1 family protein [Cryptosporidium meleagridis]
MTKSISDSEKLFLEDGVDQGIRNDGRDLTDFRPIVIALDVISTANGSSRIRNDELDIIVAVKCEIVSVTGKNESQTGGSILVNVDCSNIMDKISNVASSFTEEDYSFYITCIVKDMCFKNFDLSKLTILENKLYWNIYIDATILSFGGNMVDWVTIAIHTALRTTRIPKIHVSPSISTKENNKDVSYTVSPSVCSGTLFPFQDIPFIISAGCIRGKVIWDMNMQEQICSKTIIALSINSKGECVAMNKVYSNTLDLNLIPTIINKAAEISSEISKSLDEFFSNKQV